MKMPKYNMKFSPLTTGFKIENLKSLSHRNICTLKWNDKTVLTLFLITFGFYGWGTTSGLFSVLSFSNLSTTLALVICSTLLYLNRDKFNEYFQGSLRVELRYFIGTLIFFFLGIAINFKAITRSLTVDELAYAWISQLHSYVIAKKIFHYLPDSFQSLGSNYILQAISGILLFFGIALLVALNKLRSSFRFYLCVMLLTLAMRQVVQIGGGSNGPNSLFGNFWYFLTSTLFGINNATYRLSTLFLFSILATYVYFQISNHSILTRLCGVLTSLLIFSVPLVNSVSTIIEIANWTFIIALVCLAELVRTNFKPNFQILLFLSFAFYLRINVISLFIALLVSTLILERRSCLENKWKYFFPILIILPGLFPVIAARLVSKLNSDTNLLTDLKDNYDNFILSLFNSGSSFYAIIAAITVLILLCRKNSFHFSLLLFFLLFLLFFILNSPFISASSKYLLEYFFPFVIFLGFWPKLLHFQNKNVIMSLLVLALFLVNILGFTARQDISQTFTRVYKPSQDAISSGYSSIPFTPLPYSDVFRFIEKSGMQLCFNAGAVYSEFPRILEGVQYSEIESNIKLRSTFLEIQQSLKEEWTTISFESISAAKIKCVILGAVDQPLRIQKELKSHGWLTLGTFVDQTYGTKIFLMADQ